MPLDLKANSLKYELYDDSGYSFHVEATFDPEWGWNASVTFSASGYKTSDAAIKRLRSTAEHFLRQLNETYGQEEP